MIGFLERLLGRKQLSYEQLEIIQLVAQQVVLSVEGSVHSPGAEKKALAVELLIQMLEEIEIVAPHSLVDAMVESAVMLMKATSSVLKPREEAGV